MNNIKGFLKFGFIKKMMSPTVADMDDIGGELQETMVSPKGVYSKPLEENCIILPVMDGETQNILIPIQDFVEGLGDGDTYYTDKKSYIHMQYGDGDIKLFTRNLIIEAEESVEINTPKYTVNAPESIDFNGATINNNNVNTGDTHTHGEVMTGSSTTSTPS